MELADIPNQFARLTTVDWQIIRDTARGTYVEVGTLHGASACAALLGDTSSVTTIDIYNWQPKVWDLECAISLKSKINLISALRCTSVDYAEQRREQFGPAPFIDVLFIDGSHEYDSVKKDCEALVPYVKAGGIVMFHDHNPIGQANGVHRAVNEHLNTIPHTPRPKIEGSSHLMIVDIPNV